MKKRVFSITLCGIICCAAVVCIFSEKNNAYACEMVNNDECQISSDAKVVSDKLMKIGNNQYSICMKDTIQSEFGKKTSYDRFEVESTGLDANGCKGSITVDPTTNEIMSFHNITPFPDIPDIRRMSDDEIKKAAEEILGEILPVSKYNDFYLTRPASEVSPYHLVWRVKKQMYCDTMCEVYIDKNGAIWSFARHENCPDDLEEFPISKEERDSLLRGQIAQYLKENKVSHEGFSYSIKSELLSLYKGKPAVIYTVSIVDADGFAHCILLAIC